jgi:hypothetical protein
LGGIDLPNSLFDVVVNSGSERSLCDMIVPLLLPPDLAPRLQQLHNCGIIVRRGRAWERTHVTDFVAAEFSDRWADEVACAWARVPISAIVAFNDDRCIGFIAHSCAHPGLIGPMGVSEAHRRLGLGTALLLRSLYDLRSAGYVYGILGAVGDPDFFTRICGAVPLPAEWPSYVVDSD